MFGSFRRWLLFDCSSRYSSEGVPPPGRRLGPGAPGITFRLPPKAPRRPRVLALRAAALTACPRASRRGG
jgi:hypothetical protein